MAAMRVHYTSLINDVLEDNEVEKAPFLDDDGLSQRRTTTGSTHCQPTRCSTSYLLVASLACNVLFLIIILTSVYRISNRGMSPSSTSTLQALYSPAQHLLRPTLRKFSSAFHPKGLDAIYQQGPSTAVDAAWKALYFTTLSIDRAAAESLPNKTVPLSPAPDAQYLTGLSVFHDLHCLDSIRRALWIGLDSKDNATHTETYMKEMHDPAHLMHCVNGLRQTLMCHADVAPLSWQWSHRDKDVRVYQDVLHQCRDFEPILAWGREHAYTGDLDTTVWPDRHPPEVGACGYTDEGCGMELV